ncbi:MAG: hypothetical protein BWY73_01305 [candidate division TA06 bacterium ADurb.Bin417]|uniref:Uncharacterized protein n=1 Tax=candidate division TA06 bacterium ADurb.Bin417 TaxID=1852828 RepID=A0A1V5MCE4_UNCT6|nr:MAG: hypothetical protein BWY73_01305 [candidate division TA06 bacterium ADurb.Bin417]
MVPGGCRAGQQPGGADLPGPVRRRRRQRPGEPLPAFRPRGAEAAQGAGRQPGLRLRPEGGRLRGRGRGGALLPRGGRALPPAGPQGRHLHRQHAPLRDALQGTARGPWLGGGQRLRRALLLPVAADLPLRRLPQQPRLPGFSQGGHPDQPGGDRGGFPPLRQLVQRPRADVVPVRALPPPLPGVPGPQVPARRLPRYLRGDQPRGAQPAQPGPLQPALVRRTLAVAGHPGPAPARLDRLPVPGPGR